MSNGISPSPSSQPTRPSQHGSLQAEHSSASVGMPAAAPGHSTPQHASHNHDTQAGQGFSALYHWSDGSHQAAHSASQQAGAGVHVGSWSQEEGRDQPGSPTAATSSAPAGGADSPKTLQLKALAAQAERLRQVGAWLADIVFAGCRLQDTSARPHCTWWCVQQLVEHSVVLGVWCGLPHKLLVQANQVA